MNTVRASKRRRSRAGLTAGLCFGCLLGLAVPGQAQQKSPATRPARAPQASPSTPVDGDEYLRLDPKRVFRLESEAQLRQRMARESQEGNNPLNLKYDIFFPNYPSIPKETFVSRSWAPLGEIVDPPFVCYRRLYFEQINFERYGWDLGPLCDVLLSQGAFYFDLITLPYHAGTDLCRRYECNTGYYLPGDPAPLLLYPPRLSLTGALAEATAIGLGFVIFP
jgi:hypothetical protein